MSLCVDDLSGTQVWMEPAYQKGHLHTVTYTRCRIDKIKSPVDGHVAVRNIERTEINIYEKALCVDLVIYKEFFSLTPSYFIICTYTDYCCI